MKKTIKILSVFLASIMFFSVFSAANPVFAMELQNAEAQSVVSDADEATAETAEEAEEIEEAPEIIGEDISRRDETTKHFIMSDGTRKAIKYSNPVHFEKMANGLILIIPFLMTKQRENIQIQKTHLKYLLMKN